MKYYLFSLLSLSISFLVLIAQPALAQVTQITGIKYKLTEKGLEVILVTPTLTNLLSFPIIQDNTRIFNISKAQLSLPCGSRFSRDNPVIGIKSISVSSENSDRVSIVVKGNKSLPKVFVTVSPAKVDCIKCNFKYTDELRYQGIEGRATVVLDIDEQGNVIKANLNSSSGNAQLDNTVLAQVRNMKFINNACGEKNIRLSANFIIQGSALYQQAVEEYKLRRRQDERRQNLSNEQK